MELGDGTKHTVTEILDDATRFSLHVYVADSEAAEPVLESFRQAIDEFGLPVLVHTDNGSAFNAERWGQTTQLKAFLNDLGVRMITGRPSHPRTQGKVERSHQTIQRYIAAHAPFDEAGLRNVVAEYRQWYNHDRAHQSLPPNTTPAQAYSALPKMAPPGDPITPVPKKPPVPDPSDEPVLVQRPARSRGHISYRSTIYILGRAWQGQMLNIIQHPNKLEFFDSDGLFLFHTDWPAQHRQNGVIRKIRTCPPPLPGKLEIPPTKPVKASTKSSDPNVH